MCYGQVFRDTNETNTAILTAMALWRRHSWNYQHLPLVYHDLFALKKVMNLKGANIRVKGISKSALAEYPNNEFLGIKNAEEAEEYLLNKDLEQINRTIKAVEKIVETNYAYHCLMEACSACGSAIWRAFNPPRKFTIRELTTCGGSIPNRCHRTSANA